MNYYPVIIPTLCRFEHFRKCIESLKKCTFADKTEVVIGLDYPKKESHYEGYIKIKEYLNDIDGFAKITIFYTDINLGQGANTRRLLNYVKNKYDAYILTEDDNVFSPCFLEFLNYGLNKFKDNKKIFAITGYSPIEYENMTSNPIILSKYVFMWGFGCWVGKNAPISISYLAKNCRTFKNGIKIFMNIPAVLGMFVVMIREKTKYGDICRSVEIILDDRYILMPNVSMVRNIGQDGSGLHSGINEDILNQNITSEYHFSYTQNDLDKAFLEIKRFKHRIRSFSLMLSKNKIKAVLQLFRIITRWLCYKFSKK